MTISRTTKLADLPDLLSMVEAGTVVPVPRSTLYQLVRSGRLEGVRVGRRIMVKTSSLRRLLKEEDIRQDPPAIHQELAAV